MKNLDNEGYKLADELLRWARYLHIALPQSLYDRARQLTGELPPSVCEEYKRKENVNTD